MNARATGTAASARLLVVMMGTIWGVNWVAAHIILEALEPWQLRAVGIGIGAVTLFAAAAVRGISLAIAPGDRMKILIAGFFNVAFWGVCSAYAQLYGSTSRAVVIAYSMPIWASLLARIILKERLTSIRVAALTLCVIGLVILIFPLARAGFPLGALFALGCAWSWATGTIYMKTVRLEAPMVAVAAWQVMIGALMLIAGMLIFEGVPHFASLPLHILLWLGYNGVIGMGLAYFLWFIVIDRLPAMTASLATLLVPGVGVIASAVLLGERPSLYDAIGFACIFAAAATVLLQPATPHPEAPE
jgi:drug/metabolite transporter (DMT)-like permease